jgi:N-acetyl-alpha-D-muramate 1-phosphate uridylyltransferase
VNPLPVLLFAAGFGTRMGPLTREKPKPMVKVAGLPLIDHALNLLTEANTPKVVNLHYKAEILRDHLAGRDIQFSDESDAILETGGGLRRALPLLGKSVVATLNTDAIWQGVNPIETLMNAWRPEMEALLLTVPKDRAIGHKGAGDFIVDTNGRLTRGAGEIYTGLQIVRTDDLVNIPEDTFSMNVLWNRISERGGLYGASFSGRWCDVGQPESIALAEQMLGETDV